MHHDRWRHRFRRPAARTAPSAVQRLTPAIHITVVCRANLYRSPITAALLRRHLAPRHVEATVDSMGVAAIAGEAVPTEVAARRGIDLSAHRSRLLHPDALDAADLVLTMEHHQSAEVVIMRPESWPRVFTLREAVRRADTVEPRRRLESVPDWIGRMHRGRLRHTVAGRWGDDLADPSGQSATALLETIDTIDELVARFVARGWTREVTTPG